MLNFVNRNDKNNVGDWWASPTKYYSNTFIDLEMPFRHLDIKKFSKSKKQNNQDSLVLGGGGLFGRNSFSNQIEKILQKKINKKIIWSAGDNSKENDLKYFLNQISNFNLIGIRDFIENYEQYYVPCVSCMHPIFEKCKNTKIDHEIVIYEHKDMPIPENIKKNVSVPVMSNKGNDIESVVKFLASSEYIFTNSYHGAYWGQLLGKKVVCYSALSKFKYFKYPVLFIHFDNWFQMYKESKSVNILDECRNINQKFLTKVLEEISKE